MKKGEIAVGVIGDTVFPDRGYIEREDGRVSVRRAIPGREVEYRISKKRGERAEGTVLRVLRPSPLERAEEACVHAGACGGCLYQSLPYEEELRIKERQIRDLLRSAAGEDFAWDGFFPAPSSDGYRMKMEYSFGDAVQGGPLALGMHRSGSRYDIVTADGCRLVHEDFNRILRATLDYFSERSIPFYHKLRRDGYLRHLLVRRGTHSRELLIDLVTVSGKGYKIPPEGSPFLREIFDFSGCVEAWKERMLSLPLEGKISGILHTVTDSVADAVIDQGTELLYGKNYFEELLSGLHFKITPFSFFQNNSDGAELLYEKVAAYVGDTGGKTVFDLYSGTGTIAQLVAGAAERTVGVELSEEAVGAARENAARNGLSNCEFIAGDVLRVLDALEEKPDVIILDPPREGVNPKALAKLVRFGVPRMIYVSCKPSSLLQDLKILAEGGYRAAQALAVDMFPRTPGVEAVVLLSRS